MSGLGRDCARALHGHPNARVCPLAPPADTVKVLLQTQDSKNPVYSGAMDATRKIIKAEGLSGLYKGVASPLAGVWAPPPPFPPPAVRP